MPIVYLQPSDLSAVQAAQVLAFLNAATSAAQLDRDIEFPGEPDIGLRLGQRANGVSQLHGEVSRGMFGELWPGFDAADVPITHTFGPNTLVSFNVFTDEVP